MPYIFFVSFLVVTVLFLFHFHMKMSQHVNKMTSVNSTLSVLWLCALISTALKLHYFAF